MNLVRLRRGTRRAIVLAAVVLPVLSGCSASGAPLAPEARVTTLKTDVPVHDPVWSDNERVLLALTEGPSRIAKIDPAGKTSESPGTAHTTLSGRFPDVGENIVTSPTGNDVVYLPQPKRDRVAVVGVENLRQVRTLRAGPSPSYVAKDSGSKVLLALSEDGSTVTGVDLQESRVLPSQTVHAGPEAELDGPKRGRLIAYHVVGPRGVAHYKGPPGGVSKKGHLNIEVEKSTGDLVKASRVYIAEKGTDRLLAVDSHRWHHGLEVVAQARLGEPVHHLGVDETRLYAATEHKLVVFETNSFEGYEDHRFTTVETIDFRAALRTEALKKAPLSGLAVGPDRVYLTLRGQPHVVSVAKPDL